MQIEATVTACEVQLRPRRQLLVQVEDATGSCELRFFSFTPSHQKTMAVGNRLRIRGEVKGLWGRQMLHPAFRLAGGELPAALTPVYPTTAGLPQPYLRRAVVSALGRWIYQTPCRRGGASSCHLFESKWPPALVGIARGAHFLHHPTPDVACPRWRPQPPRLAAPEGRGVAGAAALATPVPP